MKFFTFALLITSTAAAMAQDCNARREDTIVRTVEKPYTVTTNGAVENFVYVFTAHVHGCMTQTGSAAKWFWEIDDRACAWSLSSSIQREGFFITRSGKRASLDEVKKAFSIPVRGNDMGNGIFGHSTCGDNFGRYDEIKSNLTNSVTSQMDTLLESNIFPESLSDLSRVLSGAIVAPQQ